MNYDTLKGTREELKKEIEDKWFKECERLGNEIDKLKKDVKKITETKSPKNHPEFLELKRQLKLTNEAYNDVCGERDNLKKQTKEIPNITEFRRGFEDGTKKAKEECDKKFKEFIRLLKEKIRNDWSEDFDKVIGHINKLAGLELTGKPLDLSSKSGENLI